MMAMANLPSRPPVWNPSSDERATFQEWRMMAVGQLVSFKQGIPPFKLPGRLADTAGEKIPFDKMGFDFRFRNINYFLYLMESDIECRTWDGGLYVFIRESSVPETMQNIRDMVLGQKKGKNEKPLRQHGLRVPSNHLLMRYERPKPPLQSASGFNATRTTANGRRGTRSKNSQQRRGGPGPRQLNSGPRQSTAGQVKPKPTTTTAKRYAIVAGPSTSNPKAPLLRTAFRDVFEEYKKSAHQNKVEPAEVTSSTAPSPMPRSSVLSQASSVRRSATEVDRQSYQMVFAENAKAMQKKEESRPAEPISNAPALVEKPALTPVTRRADEDVVDAATTIRSRCVLSGNKMLVESKSGPQTTVEDSNNNIKPANAKQKHQQSKAFIRYGYSLDTNMGLDYGYKSVPKYEAPTLLQFPTFKLAARFPNYLTTGSKASTSLKAFLEESGQLDQFLKSI